MKKLIIGTLAALVLCGGLLAYLAIGEVVQREKAADTLVKTVADAGAAVADDDDGGTDSVAEPRWTVGFGDGSTNAWQEARTYQGGGNDAHLFGRDGSQMMLFVTVSEPQHGTPAMEFIRGMWEATREEAGFEVLPIEMVSYDTHSWVGYQVRWDINGRRMTGMAYASIDTTARGAKLFITAVWPETENDACIAWYHEVLQRVTVERQE